MRISIMTTVMALVLNGIGPERSAAEIVKAYCTLTWEEHKPGEKGDCDFRQAFATCKSGWDNAGSLTSLTVSMEEVIYEKTQKLGSYSREKVSTH